MPSEHWHAVGSLNDFAVGAAKLVRVGGQGIAVFRVGEREFYAVDNRCPHEGYPLAQGYLKGCVLTCAWHNFKFDVRDGRCLVGDERVPTFAVRMREDEGRTVEICVPPPDPAEIVPRALDGLHEALLDRRLAQASRECVRLLRADVSPLRILAEVVAFDARFSDYGTTHALPVAADCAAMLPRYAGEKAVRAVLPAIDMASEASVRRPVRRTPSPVDPGADAASTGEALRGFVENEDADAAEALVRGAVAKGWRREIIEPWMWQLCADHFLDFGHAPIYQSKIFDWLDRTDWAFAADVLAAHVVRIVYGTREDTLPPWAKFNAVLANAEPHFAEWFAVRDGMASGAKSWDAGGFRNALLDGRAVAVGEALVAALKAGAPLTAIVDELSVAAAERVLRFDVAIDANPAFQDTWLDVSHRITVANAARHAVQKFRHPAVLRILFHTARFVAVAEKYDMPAAQRFDTAARVANDLPAAAQISEVMAAIREKRPADAIARAAAYLAAKQPLDALAHALDDYALGDPAVRPIVVAHILKTFVAGAEETACLGDHPGARLPILAAIRFAASPIRERQMERAAHEAIQFVRDGRPPTRLVD